MDFLVGNFIMSSEVKYDALSVHKLCIVRTDSEPMIKQLQKLPSWQRLNGHVSIKAVTSHLLQL